MPDRAMIGERVRETIKSLVVLDLETSGLPAFGKTRITEIALGGSLRDHILNVKDKDFSLPRVIHKLSVCVYPRKMIQYDATDMTGLDNALLEDIKPWDKDMCHMLTSFLQRLPPPVCLIAHNGMAFDFRILNAELHACNQALPEHIMCADSLHAFQTLFPKSNQIGGWKRQLTGITPLNSEPSCSRRDTEVITSTTNSVPDTGTCLSDIDSKQVDSATLHEIMLQSDAAREALRMKNETTPKQEKPCGISSRKRDLNEACDATQYKHARIRKQLFESREPRSHKLPDIYRFIHEREPHNSHHAEGDVMALFECIVAAGTPFVDWIDDNYVPLSSITPMW